MKLSVVALQAMMTSSNGNIFRVTGHLWGKFIGHYITQRRGGGGGVLVGDGVGGFINIDYLYPSIDK